MSMTAPELVAQAKQSIREVDHAETQTAIDGNTILLDVREPGEYEMGHLPGAVNVPRGVLEFKVGMHPALQDSSASIFLYCKTGGRSALATQSLQTMGFTSVASVAGGFDGWAEAGQAVEKNPEAC